MTELVLVRHAQASFGSEDYDRLSPLGHQQASWLGAYFDAHDLSFERVVRGNLRRHRETAEAVCAALGLPEPEIDPRLDEFHYGPLEAAYVAHTNRLPAANREDFLDIFGKILAAWEADTLGVAGEGLEEFSERVSAAMAAAMVPGKRVLVITSGGVIGVMLRRVMGLGIEATADVMLNIHNASVHRLVEEGGRLRLSLYNASPHLDPQDRAHARTFV